MYRKSGRDDEPVPSPLAVPRSLRWPKYCAKCAIAGRKIVEMTRALGAAADE